MSKQDQERTVLTIRADGGADIGYGHLMRTMAVANQIKEIGNTKIQYLANPGTDRDFIEAYGFDVLISDEETIAGSLESINPISGPLLLDSYSVTEADLDQLKKRGFEVSLFEDGKRLSNYEAGLVIDSSPAASDSGYEELQSNFLLGADYFPVRKEFLDSTSNKIGEQVKTITVTFGGSDPEDLTILIFELLQRMDLDAQVNVILGPGYEGEVYPAMQDEQFTILEAPDNMAEILASSDLVIASAGMTSLELSYLGRPMILFSLSKDQEPNISSISESGAALLSGNFGVLDSVVFKDQVLETIQSSKKRKSMSEAGQKLVDGEGAKRIAEKIMTLWSEKSN